MSLLLFLPFLYLPIALWWAIPIGAVVWSVWSWRPTRWIYPLIALLMIWPRSTGGLIVGNTDMWVCAFVALGLRYGWPALLIAIKPSFAPLMLVGIRHRSWWWGLPVLAIVCLPFGALWFDWLAVIRNAPANLAYSFANLPLMFVPIVAWLGRTGSATCRRTTSRHRPT